MATTTPAWLDDGTWLALGGSAALTLVGQLRAAGLGPQERPPPWFWLAAGAALAGAVVLNRPRAASATPPSGPAPQLTARPQGVIGALSPVAVAFFRRASKDKLVVSGGTNANANSVTLRLRSNAALKHWLDKAKKAAAAANKGMQWKIKGRRQLTVTFSR
jgi:hypothetical protein